MRNVSLVLLGIPVLGCSGADPTALLEGTPAPSAEAGPDQGPSPDGAGIDAGVSSADAAPCGPCLLKVDYFTSTTTAQGTQIQPNIEILNTGPTALDLTTVTVRYWFTADGSSSQAFTCDYAT